MIVNLKIIEVNCFHKNTTIETFGQPWVTLAFFTKTVNFPACCALRKSQRMLSKSSWIIRVRDYQWRGSVF